MAATLQDHRQRKLLLWLPSTLLASYLLTLLICIPQSIAASGGSPCGPYVPCDVSVYGGFPKDGPQFTTFRLGFTLMGVQLAFLIWARLSSVQPRDSAFVKEASSFVMAICCLLLMAYIPFWKSPLHFLFAILTFVFLGVGQGVDAAHSEPPYKCARQVIFVLTMTCFFGWAVSPLLLGYPISILEYIATILPFAYFLTWSIEVAKSPCPDPNSRGFLEQVSVAPC